VSKKSFPVFELWLVLIVFLLPLSTQAAIDSLWVNLAKGKEQIKNINQKICILEDSTNTSSFAWATGVKQTKQFLPYTEFKKRTPRLQKGKTYWARFTINNESYHNHWILYVGRASNIEFYAPDSLGKYQKKISGRSVPGSQRDIRSIIVESRYKFHLLLYKKQTTIYIKLKGDLHTPKFDLKFVKPSLFYTKSSQAKIIQSIFQGALWIIILYNLILFVQVKDKTYLFYVLYALSHSFYYLAYYDILNESPTLQFLTSAIASQTSMLCYFLFMRLFVNTKKILPKWGKLIGKWVKIKFVLTIILAIWLGVTLELYLGTLGAVSILLVDLIFFLITLFLLLRTKSVLARYFVAGSSFLMLGWILSIIGFSTLLNIDAKSNLRWGFENNYFSQIGIFLELVLFSVGLGYRERKNEQDKRLAQEENARILREQNVTLERKVKERTREITEKNEELHMQKEEILSQRDSLQERGEELQFAYNQITDSVRYAQTIQNAILPFEPKIKQIFEEYFIIYQPKDIVSGDFYWFNTIQGENSTKTVAAVIDCTGHGVPGAFMSMIGNTLLNETINEKHIFDPARVITLLHQKIRSDLRQAETNNSDGMDMSLCVIEPLANDEFKLVFSGAKRPLYYVHQGEFNQLKADRFSIGGEVYEDERERIFTNKELILSKGDALYMMTDGFGDTPDDERRRFGSRNIKKMIKENVALPMQRQKTVFEDTLTKHQGSQEARDDVTMLGLRL
jgi:serine phosphatase RsbU (regulator of sigma subunit)